MTIRLYHNARCSKSRAALTLLEARMENFEIVPYLDEPLDKAELRELLGKLGLGPRDVIRKGEALYKELDLKDPALGDDALITAIASHPVPLERPIVVNGEKAVVGRPTEAILDIL